MKTGLILNNAYANIKSSLNQSLRLKDEFEKLGVQIDIQKNNFFANYVSSDGEIASLVNHYDFCVYLDKDKYILKMLEKVGVRTFNSYESIITCDDKMLTHIALSQHQIKMPTTLSGLLCYSDDGIIIPSTLEKIENILQYPIVVKESYGSLGKSVFLVKNHDELLSKMEELKLKPHLFQQLIKSSYGKDVRVIVIGKKVFASMQRISKTDFRSNIELGGVGEPFELNDQFIQISEKVAEILDLDYCGIDLLFGENGEPIVCEVNSNAFFGGIETVTHLNVAKRYAEYIYNLI
ncbi:MAG: RimK family alpha-L-glutamate ligase [Clostridia bacterium]